MEIGVDGIRTSAADWQAVRNLPSEQLPKLSEAQQEVAKKLRISEEDYARSALAGQRTTDALLAKTKTLARFLDQKIHAIDGAASIDRIVLRTWEHRFDIEVRKNSHKLRLRIDENLIDDLLESGSQEAEQRISSILRNGLALQEQ